MAVAPMLISRMSACASLRRSTSSRIVWPNAVNSWPSVIGTASCNCVRPIFTNAENSSPLCRNAAASADIAPRSDSMLMCKAIFTAVGYTSFVD